MPTLQQSAYRQEAQGGWFNGLLDCLFPVVPVPPPAPPAKPLLSLACILQRGKLAQGTCNGLEQREFANPPTLRLLCAPGDNTMSI